MGVNDIDPQEFQALRAEMKEMRADIKDLVNAWRTAQGVVRVVRLIGAVAKWLAGVGGSIAALWAILKYGLGR